jgi:hypothetical protein
VGTRDGPLIITWELGVVRRLAVLFGFDEPTTDWPRRAGFPVFWSHALEWLCPTESRPSALRTYLPLEALPGGGGVAPARPGFYRDGVRGGAVGVSFIGTDEGFQAGPGRDESAAAAEAIRKSIEVRRRATLAEAWPYLAAAALVLVILRSVAAR